MTVSGRSAPTSKPSIRMRRIMVGALAKQGISNREIARRVLHDEATVRRDLQFLRTPEDKRPVKAPRPKKIKLLTPAERLKQMLKVLHQWTVDQALIRPDLLWILPEVGKRLYFKSRLIPNTTASSSLSPAELLPLARPADYQDGDMSDKLESCVTWLAAWLDRCAPGNAALRDEVLNKTERWAEVSL